MSAIVDEIPNPSRNRSIDIIRGLCVLSVILLHYNIHFKVSESFIKDFLPTKVFSLLFWSGHYGVIVFFTLSGYLITNSILKKFGSLAHIKLKTFYWFRFARIMPPLAALLVILSVLHLCEVPGFIISPEKTSLARAILAVLTFHFNYLEIQVGYLPANWDVLWSISIEESFYLLFPIVCLVLRKDQYFLVFVVIFLFLSPWARTHLYVGNDLGEKNHLAFLDAISIGCFVAIIIARYSIPEWFIRLSLALAVIFITSVLLFRSIVREIGLTEIGLNITLLSLGIGMLLIFINRKPTLQPIRTRKAFNWLHTMGQYSYEIYLTHSFAVIIGSRIYKHYQFEPEWLIPFGLAILLVSYFMGKFAFEYFSNPLNNWLRKKWHERSTKQ